MSRKHGGILIATVLVTSGIVGWMAWMTLSLPEPQHASRSQLLKWLVMRDLADESRHTRRALIERFQQELLAGQRFAARSDQVHASRRVQLLANVDLLQRDWFEWAAERYGRCEQDERLPYLERQIQTVLSWTQVEADLAETTASAEKSKSSLGHFFQRIENWLDEAADKQRKKMKRGVHDGIVCWLATRDLNQQSTETRGELARRILEGLDTGIVSGSLSLPLNDGQRKQLASNGELLLAARLQDQTRAYFALEAKQRNAYVDKQIAAYVNRGVPTLLSRLAGKSSENGPSAFVQFNQKIEALVARAPENEQAKLKQVITHVKQRLLPFMLRRMSQTQ